MFVKLLTTPGDLNIFFSVFVEVVDELFIIEINADKTNVIIVVAFIENALTKHSRLLLIILPFSLVYF